MQAPLDVIVSCELDDEAKKVDHAAKEVLGSNFLEIRLKGVRLEENCDTHSSLLYAQIQLYSPEATRTIDASGYGVGLVDAAFDGMMKAFSAEHISLSGISIADFCITSKFRDTDGRKSDAYAIALLRMRNSENREFAFTCRTPSISGSSLAVVAQAFAFFINSERAFTQLHLATQDAKARNRQDLVERFKRHMAVLVSATSYKQLVDRINQKPKGVANG